MSAVREITKRLRNFDIDEHHLKECESKSHKKNNHKATFDFKCSAFHSGNIITFRLSEAFQNARYTILFFCSYDFTEQSKVDLYQIQEFFSTFFLRGALPLVITQDSAYTHRMYATPGQTSVSLSFKPSFVLASDFEDRLISIAYDAMDMETREIRRTVVVVADTLEVIWHYYVPEGEPLPLLVLVDCFAQP